MTVLVARLSTLLDHFSEVHPWKLPVRIHLCLVLVLGHAMVSIGNHGAKDCFALVV